MHKRDFRGDIGQVKCFLDSRVASADDGDGLAAVEKTVARRTGGHTTALVCLFGVETEVHCRRARCDDQRVAGVVAVIALETERPLRDVGLVNVIVDHFGVEALRVSQHAIHEFRALQAFDITRPVVDIGCRHQLTALFDARDHDRIEVGARRVNGRSVTRRPRAQDQNPAMSCVTHVYFDRYSTTCKSARRRP